MFRRIPRAESEPQPGQIAIMCIACGKPVAHIYLNNPIGLSLTLTSHFQETGHGADNFYTEPKTEMRFFPSGNEGIAYNSTGQ